MDQVKRFKIDGKVYTFDVSYEEQTRCGTVWLGKCRENGKEAWLDAAGVQFDGRRRAPAQEVFSSSGTDGSYQLWGGQLRDKLPCSARYYLRLR